MLVVFAANFMPVQTSRDGVNYWQGKVVAVGESDQNTRNVKLLSGPYSGQEVTANVGALIGSLDLAPPLYDTGDIVLVSTSENTEGQEVFNVIDYYRIPSAVWLFVLVIILAVVFAGWRGLGALVGLIFSIFVLAQFVVPQILEGNAPYLVTAIGIMVITLPGIYIAHGVSRRTTIALIGTYITLTMAVILSIIAVKLTRLSGVSNEDIWLLSQIKPELNIRGLLLCGLLISLVGVLDDVTVSQSAAVQELHNANPKLDKKELYKRGLKIGREHIASLINTLVLVYVGASFLFITYLIVVLPFPLLVVLNSEFMMEEIVRSLVATASLILAVPITTLLAAQYLPKSKKKNPSLPS